MMNQKAFALIELLVVVLIIGILAAVALPQYQKAVEKARMAEAVTLVRAIANAHQLYYIANGSYLSATEIDKLDIEIPGTINHQHGAKRIKTKDFIYSPNGQGTGVENLLALAQRSSLDEEKIAVYYIYIKQDSPQTIRCTNLTYATAIQQKLCRELDSNGTL